MRNHRLLPPRLLERVETLRIIMLEVSGMDAFDTKRNLESVTARMMVAYQLYQEGFFEAEIASVLNKDHATVHFYRDRMMAVLNTPGWEAERKIWKEFKERI